LAMEGGVVGVWCWMTRCAWSQVEASGLVSELPTD